MKLTLWLSITGIILAVLLPLVGFASVYGALKSDVGHNTETIVSVRSDFKNYLERDRALYGRIESLTAEIKALKSTVNGLRTDIRDLQRKD